MVTAYFHIWYNFSSEKICGNYSISRNVRWSIKFINDVESTKRRRGTVSAIESA